MTRNAVGERLDGGAAPESPVPGDPLTRRELRARFAAAAARTGPVETGDPGPPPRRRPRWSVPPRTALTALLALALVAGAVVLRSLSAASGTPVELAEPRATAPATATAGPGPVGASADAPALLVHVVGQVAAPGLVELPADARVSDALDAAGGPLPDADLAALNLAAPVQDGAQVRVPGPGESVELPATEAAAPGPADGRVDLNRATAAQLEQLPGVGPVLADRIVADREAQGPFGSVDDLERVTGIGPAVLAGLRDRATV